MIDFHDPTELEQLRKQLRLDPHEVRLVRNAYYKRLRTPDEAIASLDESARQVFRESVQFETLTLEDRFDSSVDGATRLIFRTAAGHLIESVILRIATGRTTLCVSCQVGCAANCRFCATGQMGIARNLSCGEIVEQVVRASRILDDEGRRLRNVVFMGMGEPFHNEEHLYAALDVLHSPQAFARSARRTLVSTVGIPEAMIRCGREHPEVGIALSLHSARPEVRETLIPLSRRHTLDELHAALRELNSLQDHPVMIEYLMLAGLTDTDGDLVALRRYLDGLNVHVNLIPFNAIDEASDLIASEAARITEFAQELKDAGFTTTVRYSLGADVAAACGQLVQRANRA